MHYIIIWGYLSTNLGFSGGTSSKEPTWQYRRCKKCGLIPGSGRCPGGEHGNLFQHFCLKNHTDRGAWLATVHNVANNLNGWACTHAHPLTPTGSWWKFSWGECTPLLTSVLLYTTVRLQWSLEARENQTVTVQFSSVAQSCPTLSDPTDCSISDVIQSSHPVTPFSSHLQSFPASGSFPTNQFFASGGQRIGVSTSASVLPMNIQDWLSFRIDWLDLLAVQGTLESLLQHHSSKASILQHSAFFIVQLSHPNMNTRKTIPLTRWAFVSKAMSLLFNMLLGCSQLFFQGAIVS